MTEAQYPKNPRRNKQTKMLYYPPSQVHEGHIPVLEEANEGGHARSWTHHYDGDWRVIG